MITLADNWTACESVAEGFVILFASWQAVEPERGRYDDAVLDLGRRHLLTARRRGLTAIVVTHAGALPDWQIARDGWMDPDCLAGYGCFVDVLAHRWGESVRWWVGLWRPIREASVYGDDYKHVIRALIDAQASAFLHLRKAPGPGGQGTRVGFAERFGAGRTGRSSALGRLAGEPLTRLRSRWSPDPAHALAYIFASGRLALPFAPVGELPNATPATDFMVAIDTTAEDLKRLDQCARPCFLVGAAPEHTAAWVLAR